MNPTSPIAYVRAHWAGQLGLAWSFWVNLVALRLAITLGQSVLLTNAEPEIVPIFSGVFLLSVFFHGPVFAWQAVGVFRAGEHYLRQLGSITNIWGAQLGVLIAFWFALSDMWGVWLVSKSIRDSVSIAEKMADGHLEMYSLSLSADRKTLTFLGTIALGSTKSLYAIISATPSIETLALTSEGGNIYEARGLAKIAYEFDLNTVVIADCSSACTVAFIGGVSRRLAPGARLGFHQYRIDVAYYVPFANPKFHETHDLELFRQAGVEDWFLIKMFRKPPDEMWYPAEVELRNSGVLVSD